MVRRLVAGERVAGERVAGERVAGERVVRSAGRWPAGPSTCRAEA